MRATNVTNSQTQNAQNSARDTNVTNNETKHIQNSARDTNIRKSQQNKYETVHETLT